MNQLNNGHVKKSKVQYNLDFEAGLGRGARGTQGAVQPETLKPGNFKPRTLQAMACKPKALKPNTIKDKSLN